MILMEKDGKIVLKVIKRSSQPQIFSYFCQHTVHH